MCAITETTASTQVNSAETIEQWSQTLIETLKVILYEKHCTLSSVGMSNQLLQID